MGCKCENLTKEQVLYNILYIIRNNEGEKLEDLVCDFVRNYFKNEEKNKWNLLLFLNAFIIFLYSDLSTSSILKLKSK